MSNLFGFDQHLEVLRWFDSQAVSVVWFDKDLAGGPAAFTISAEAGSYAVTGTSASLEFGRLIVAASGSYVLTGSAAGLAKGTPIAAVSGSYVLTGQAASLEFGHLIAAVSGSYVWTGAIANLAKGRTIDAVAGSYVLSGMAASLEAGLKIVAAAGAYVLTGAVAALAKTIPISAAGGVYVLTGFDVDLIADVQAQIIQDSGGIWPPDYPIVRMIGPRVRVPRGRVYVIPAPEPSLLDALVQVRRLTVPIPGERVRGTVVLPVLRVPEGWRPVTLKEVRQRAKLALAQANRPSLKAPLGARLGALAGARLVVPVASEVSVGQVRMFVPDSDDMEWVLFV